MNSVRTAPLPTVLLALAAISPCSGQELDSRVDGGTPLPPPPGVTQLPQATTRSILVGLFLPKWKTAGNAAQVKQKVEGAFDWMNAFWKEASYQSVSYSMRFAYPRFWPLPASYRYYYIPETDREIYGTLLPPQIDLPSGKTLILRSTGIEIQVQLPAGQNMLTSIEQRVSDAIRRVPAGSEAPTARFRLVDGNYFRLTSTVDDGELQVVEVDGDAVPWLGLGLTSFYNQGPRGPSRIEYSLPLPQKVTFPQPQTLLVKTDGLPTTVNFPAGEIELTDVVDLITKAYRGRQVQQPYSVRLETYPPDPTKRLLVFQTRPTMVQMGGLTVTDYGYDVYVEGDARPTLGLSAPGQVYKYSEETLRGNHAAFHGFSDHASSNPNVHYDTYNDAHLLVGLVFDDERLRAHYGSQVPVRIGRRWVNKPYVLMTADDPELEETFAHEAGHDLGLPDLYEDEETIKSLDEYDVMSCGCDAHPGAWLKLNRNGGTLGGPWVPQGTVASITRPAAGTSVVDTFLISPLEGEFAKSNPFRQSSPNVRLVHAVELRLSGTDDVILVENRQVGPFRTTHFGKVERSTEVPAEGVIISRGRTAQNVAQPVELLTATALQAVGDDFRKQIGGDRFVLKILNKVENPRPAGAVVTHTYLVEVSWLHP